ILRSGQHRECAHPVIPDKAARLGSGRAWRHVPYPGIELDSQEHAASRGKEKTRRSVEFGQQRRIAVAVEPRERSGEGLDDPAAEVHDTYGGAPAIADQQIISSDHQPAWVADHCRSGWASISAVTLNAVSRESVAGSRGIDYPYTVVHGIGDEQVAASIDQQPSWEVQLGCGRRNAITVVPLDAVACNRRNDPGGVDLANHLVNDVGKE